MTFHHQLSKLLVIALKKVDTFLICGHAENSKWFEISNYITMNSTCFEMIPFGVVFLTFSRAAAASSVLGISVTTCLTKCFIRICTSFELPRIPITLLTDYSLSDSDNWPDPSFHFFGQIATLLFQQRSTHLPRSMMFIIFDYLYYLSSMLQPETFDPKKFCWIKAGSSTRWILAWF